MTKIKLLLKIYVLNILYLFFFTGCKEEFNREKEDNSSLNLGTLIFDLDTIRGYIINPITDDSIHPLINSIGTEIKTGVVIPFNGEIISNTQPPIKSKPALPKTIIIPTNAHPVPQHLRKVLVDSSKLIKIRLSDMDPPIVTIAAGKKIPINEPVPIKALPMRYKDNATFPIQYLDVAQGLSSSYVNDIMEDRKGNLWFAMGETGLSKYNGIEITHYGIKEGLSGKGGVGLLQDSKGNIWIGTDKGVTLYDGKNFIQFTQKEGFTNNDVGSISEDKKGNIWFGTMTGAYKYDGKKFTHYTKRQGLPADSVTSCFPDSKGNVWFATTRGISCFDGETFTHFSQKCGLSVKQPQTIVEDNEGHLWFNDYYSTETSLVCYDGKSFTLYGELDGLQGNQYLGVLKDKTGNIWASSLENGMYKFDGYHFSHYGLSEGLSSFKVRKMFEDSYGNLWLATEGGGVNKLNANGFSYPFPDDLLGSNRIRPIAKDGMGNLWLGTDGDRLFKSITGTSNQFLSFTSKEGLSGLGQRSLYAEKSGKLLIGTSGNSSISLFDGKRFIALNKEYGSTDGGVLAICKDNKGNYWFGTYEKGIFIYDGKHFIQITEKEGLSAKKVLEIKQDNKHNIWLGTENGGLIKYDGTSMIIYAEKQGMFANAVTSILEDKDGSIWLGTQGAGVCNFDGKKFTYYTEKQGLSNNNVWSLLKDSSGNIWAGTDKGLNCLLKDGNKYIIYNYGQQNGIKLPDFNLHSAAMDNNNHTWWGTGKNVLTRDMNVPVKKGNARSMQLNYIELNDSFYDFRNLPDSIKKNISYKSIAPFSNCPEGLTVSHNFNHFSFHFSAIDWASPDKIKYSYRIIGVDKNWSNPSKENIAEYRNLSYGKYELQVKAIGQSQVWTETLSYKFSVLPAWWQTWWCKAIMAAIASLLVFIIVRFIYKTRIRKQRILFEKQLAVQYERQRISAEMHDDVGASLSGIKLLTELAKKKITDEHAVAEIEKIYDSVGTISANMKEVIWGLEVENDRLENLVTFIQKQVRRLLENYPCELTIQIPDKIPTIIINGIDRRNIYLLVKEAIHNIIKHSGADKINISISCVDKITILIADNGMGLGKNEKKDTGNGMKNMQHRIHQLNGKIFIKNENGLILTFEIPLPILS